MQPEFFIKNVYCDKCGEETVVETIKTPETFKEPRKSMADYQGIGGTMIIDAVYRLTHYRLECKSCGNVREFSR